MTPGVRRGAGRERVRRACAPVVALAIVLVGLAGCGSGGSGPAEPGADTTARLASVMVGSDTVLGPDDVVAVNVIGLDLATLATPLRTWWATFNDAEVDEATWLADAPELLDAMHTTVADIGAQLGPGRDPAVRATFTPYLAQWKLVLDSLDAMRAGVRDGDLAAQQRATDAYNTAVAAMQRLDAQRVNRVVDAYGRAEATRALIAQGLDPARFGLG